ncbi:Hypothetical protein Minf_2245 [Methylacidiphilum infernorum V4]|uniref:Uncharacterized protein n=1 Tax=Methylacidiphilum infernorum (isolate V4) TaxID=481448 RepID=B3DZW4_METI4|nr:Hypothetical protein Minf_2245 [Methylacidiphilum infernorum V4]
MHIRRKKNCFPMASSAVSIGFKRKAVSRKRAVCLRKVYESC